MDLQTRTLALLEEAQLEKAQLEKAQYLALILVLGMALESGRAVTAHGQEVTIARAAQSRPAAGPRPSQVVAEVPFRLVNNHLILPLSVNGSEPLDVALDTGMPAAGLAIYDHPRNADLGLDINPAMRAQVGGAGGDGERVEVQIALSENLSLPGLELTNERVIVMPPMPEMSGYHDGILGYSLFGKYVVELDYDRKVLRLHRADGYEPPDDALIVPLTFERLLPYAEVSLDLGTGSTFSVKVAVDLGASHAISLNRDESERIHLPTKTLSTTIGRGLSGPVLGEVGRIRGLGLGGAWLHEVIATFPVSDHQNPRGVDALAGNLGSDVLRRFNTTFDYAGQRMILVPNRSHDEPFGFDRSGLRLGMGEQLRVEAVVDGSPAAEAGIEVGDFLTHLDGSPVTADDYPEVRSKLMGVGDVELTLERAGKAFEKPIRLRRLI